MKKIICLIISFCLIFSMSIPVFATSDSSETPSFSGEYSVATVEIDGSMLEVPVIKDEVSTTRSSDGVITSVHTIFIPDGTADSYEKNEQIVSDIKLYGSPRTRGYGDFYVDGYIWFHSTLNYTSTTRNGATYFDLISFKLEREIYVESVFNDFHEADADVMQIGADFYDDLDSLDQEKSYSSISYNTLYSLPSSWIPVYNVGYYIGVEYSVAIDYNDSLNLTDYTLTYIHEAV